MTMTYKKVLLINEALFYGSGLKLTLNKVHLSNESLDIYSYLVELLYSTIHCQTNTQQ